MADMPVITNDPMEAFWRFCMAQPEYRSLMAERSEDEWLHDEDELTLLDDAIRDFRANYLAEEMTGVLPGLEAV